MSVTVTGDERDRKREGAVKEAMELKARAERGDSEAGRALTRRITELDRTMLANPQNPKVYRFGDGERKGRIGQLKGMGYEVVPPGDKCQAIQGYEVDGAQRVGSMILMQTTRQNYERRKADKQLIADMQTGAFNDKTRENLEQIPGVTGTFDESGDVKS